MYFSPLGVVFGFFSNLIQLKTSLCILMLPGQMQTEGIFTLECTFTMVTIVAEVSGEMGTFNVVPHIVSMCAKLPAESAPELGLPFLGRRLLYVLVKHFPCTKKS